MSDPAANVRQAERLHKKQMKLAPDQLVMSDRDAMRQQQLRDADYREHGVMDEQFPTASLTAYDPRDREMISRLQLNIPGKPGYTPFGRMEAREEDFKWLAKKEAAAEEANFQRWFAENFDKMDPAQKKRAKELFPAFYAQRKKLLKRQTKNLFRLAKLKLEGVESMKDLETQYLAETGRLDVGPLTHILNPEDPEMSEKDQQMTFIRGLANPFLVFGKEAYPDTVRDRERRAEAFAIRENAGGEAGLGVQRFGFPPFNADQAGQGTAAWWKVLNQTGGNINATVG